MRLFKKMNAALALALTLALVAPVVTPVTNVAVAEAAAIKLSKKKKNLKVGKSFKLKVKGTSEKATFASSDEAIAKVDKKAYISCESDILPFLYVMAKLVKPVTERVFFIPKKMA